MVLLRGGRVGSAYVGWVSQLPQQCERLLPPGSVLTVLEPPSSAAGAPRPPELTATRGVRCVDAALSAYTQPQPYSFGFVASPPTAELKPGIVSIQEAAGGALTKYFVSGGFASSDARPAPHALHSARA